MCIWISDNQFAWNVNCKHCKEFVDLDRLSNHFVFRFQLIWLLFMVCIVYHVNRFIFWWVNACIAVPFLQRVGRKLLLEFSAKAPIPHQLPREDQLVKERKNYSFSSVKDKLTLAIPGTFLLCCILLCPCFRAKRKDPTEHHVLANELSQSEST